MVEGLVRMTASPCNLPLGGEGMPDCTWMCIKPMHTDIKPDKAPHRVAEPNKPQTLLSFGVVAASLVPCMIFLSDVAPALRGYAPVSPPSGFVAASSFWHVQYEFARPVFPNTAF